MSTIYYILGVVGWAATAAVIAAYVWKGRRPPPRGFDVTETSGTATKVEV